MSRRLLAGLTALILTGAALLVGPAAPAASAASAQAMGAALATDVGANSTIEIRSGAKPATHA